MKILNHTPHAINVYNEEQYDFNPEIRKFILKENQTPVEVFEPSGILKNVKFENKIVEEINNLSIYKKTVVDIDEIDTTVENIVSVPFAAAYLDVNKNTENLLVIKDLIVNKEGTPVGCTGLRRF